MGNLFDRFTLQANIITERLPAGGTVRRWTAHSKAEAQRALFLLRTMEGLAALDAAGSNCTYSEIRDLPAYGVLDRAKLDLRLRDLIAVLHSAGFTTCIGCRYYVLRNPKEDRSR